MLKDRIRVDQLPGSRVVIEVLAHGDRQACAWLVCEKGGVSMCFDPPGFDVDLWLRGDAGILYKVWLQQTTMAAAFQDGAVKADGSADLVRVFPLWFDANPEHAIA
jgi:hypothetical protein